MKAGDIIKLNGRAWRATQANADRIILRAITDTPGRLKAWREKKKLSQRAAAEKLGISQAVLAKVELGLRPAPPEILAKLTHP